MLPTDDAEELVTKDFLRAETQELVTKDFLRAELTAFATKDHLRAELAELRLDLTGQLAAVHTELAGRESRLTLRLGSAIAASAGVTVAALALLS